MPIGNQASYSTVTVNAELAAVATEMHNANAHATDFFERINKLGVTGLQALGFSPADANAIFTLANQMNSAGLFWFGTLPTPTVFPYDDASAAAR
jgi:hypothetical protein